MDIYALKENLSKLFKIKQNEITLVYDNRPNAKKGLTPSYQLGLNINNKDNYDKIQKILMKFMETFPECSKVNSNTLKCPIRKNSFWHIYGDYYGPANFTLMYPEKFEGSKIYTINHGVGERLIISPVIFKKKHVVKTINKLGKSQKKTKKRGGRKKTRKTKGKSKKIEKTKEKSKKELCSKYKDKIVRKTPKNWAYNKCLKSDWEKCKTLPPSGWGMYRYFCD